MSKKKHELEPEQELPVEDLKAEAEQAGVEESVDVQKVVDAAHGELDK